MACLHALGQGADQTPGHEYYGTRMYGRPSSRTVGKRSPEYLSAGHSREQHDNDKLSIIGCPYERLETLMRKCESRIIPAPGFDAMDDPDIRRRAQAEWNTIDVEVGDLPEFEDCFGRVRTFYRMLPWGG